MVNLSVMQWAEVLSADAFSAFEDVGLDNDKVRFLFSFFCAVWRRYTVNIVILYCLWTCFVFNEENPLFSMFNTPYYSVSCLMILQQFLILLSLLSYM